MALGDKIELLRVRLEEMLGEQAFIEGVWRAAHCPQQRDARALSVPCHPVWHA